MSEKPKTVQPEGERDLWSLLAPATFVTQSGETLNWEDIQEVQELFLKMQLQCEIGYWLINQHPDRLDPLREEMSKLGWKDLNEFFWDEVNSHLVPFDSGPSWKTVTKLAEELLETYIYHSRYHLKWTAAAALSSMDEFDWCQRAGEQATRDINLPTGKTIDFIPARRGAGHVRGGFLK